jgi:hypothetical protein
LGYIEEKRKKNNAKTTEERKPFWDEFVQLIEERQESLYFRSEGETRPLSFYGNGKFWRIDFV